MRALNDAVARIALEVHPDRVLAVCSALGVTKDANVFAVVKDALGSAFSPELITSLADALMVTPAISPAELSTMFPASSATAGLAAGALSADWFAAVPSQE